MMNKNNIPLIGEKLKSGKNRKKGEKIVALVAPSFVSTFSYPSLILQLRELGFDKVVELTFGAKMVNREYHELLSLKKKEIRKKENNFLISSTCPGIVITIKKCYPKYIKNIIKVDSPMIATAKICRRIYPRHKTCFISPCEMKKIEAEGSKYIDYVIDYQQLADLFLKNKINSRKINQNCIFFDKFYNDYTKIYPLSGGLSKTANLRGILKPEEEKIIDGIKDVEKFLDNPDPAVRFLDVTFCNGGCIGGPHTSHVSIAKKKKRLMSYMNIAKEEKIPKGRAGIVRKAKGIRFRN